MRRILALISLMGAVVFGQVPVGTEIPNVARSAYFDGDSSVVNITNEVTTTVAAGYYLRLAKSVDASMVTPGDTITYTISLSNTGNIPTPSFELIDTLSWYLAPLSTHPVATVIGHVVTWDIPGLFPGQESSGILEALVLPGAPGGVQIPNQAWADLSDGLLLPTNTVAVQVGSAPALQLEKTVVDSVAMPGDTLRFDLLAINSGNMLSLETMLTDDLPDGLEFISATEGGVLSGSTVTWMLDDLAPQDSSLQSVFVRVADTVIPNSTVWNTALVQNNAGIQTQAQASVFLYPWTLPITKTAAPGEYGFGDTVVFQIGLNNTSDDQILDVVVTDTLPEPLLFATASHSGSLDGRVVTWFLGTLAPHTARNLTLTTTVGSLVEATPEITNFAQVTTVNAGGNVDSTVIHLNAFPEMVLEKTAPASAMAGDSILYSIHVANQGVTQATNVVLIDSLPIAVDFIDASGNGVYDEISHRIVWTWETMSSAQLDTVWVQVAPVIPISDGTVLVNHASLTNDEGQYVADEASTTLSSTPDLIAEVGTDVLTISGDTLSYRITYRNRGTAIATVVALRDSLPDGLSFLSGDQGVSYQPEDHSLYWDLPDLVPGDSGMVLFQATVNSGLPRGTVLENATILSCDENVQDRGICSTLVRAPELVLTLEADTNLVAAGDIFDYLITFANVGDTTATNVVLIDSLPEFTYYVSNSAGGEYDEEAHTLTWMLGDLEPESSGTVTTGLHAKLEEDRRQVEPLTRAEDQPYEVTVEVANPISNGTQLQTTVLILSSESGVASAATAAATVPVKSAPVLYLNKHAEIELFPGDTVHYQIEYGNTGTDMATGVVLRDTLDSRIMLLEISGDYTYDAPDRAIAWDLGTLAVNDTGSVSITAVLPDNLADGDFVGNTAWLFSDQHPPLGAAARTTNILPMTVQLSASPRLILGNGTSTSTLQADVYSFLGNPAPDGIPVNFFTDHGLIPDSLFTATTSNGSAFSTLVSDTVLNQPVLATPAARAVYSATKWAEDTTNVVFLIGAFEGMIYNNEGQPQTDVRVELQHVSTGNFAGEDSTDENGYYFIPIYMDDLYQITYTLTDDFGNPYETIQIMEISAPDSGAVVTNLNSVSGWLYDAITGGIIAEDSILVTLIGQPDSSEGLGKLAGVAGFRDSTYTDSTGKYFFTNLESGTYALRADYNGLQSYSDGFLDVNLSQSGLYIVSANLLLRQSPFFMTKTVAEAEAAVGDTIHYQINFGTNGISWTDSIWIVDELPTGLEFIESSLQLPSGLVFGQYDSSSNEISFSRSDLLINDSLELRFDTRVTNEAGLGVIENIAYITNQTDTSFSANDSRSHARTKIIFPFLQVTKQASRRVVEPGDILTYTVRITNTSASDPVLDLVIDDVLPRGFKYRSNGSRLNMEPTDDPVITPAAGKRLALTWTLGDTLGAGETLELKYRIIAGLNARQGSNVNQVMAYALTFQGYPISSNLGEAEVILRPGILSDKGLIIGKVYYDENANGMHDEAEAPAPGVELILETGARVTVDEYGKFSIPDVSAAMHVLRINERTLPPLAEVIEDSPDYLGDTRSRLVRVLAGSMAKVSIAIREVAIPATVTGHVYFDANENSLFDEGEEVQPDVMVFLSDSVITKAGADGAFAFSDLPLGIHTLRIDETSMPTYAQLMDEISDTLLISRNKWRFALKSGDSLQVDIPLQKHDLYSALSKQATLDVHTQMLTKEFRLMVYKPWKYELHLGFGSGEATIQPELLSDLGNAAKLLNWQTHLNLSIIGHTDNVPPSAGRSYSSNMELSQARADAIRDWLIQNGGIDADRIKAVGIGEFQPVADNSTPEGRAMNRRVELVFQSTKMNDDLNQIQFQYDLHYSGEVSLDSIRFHQTLPAGFTYREESANLDGEITPPALHEESHDMWNLGSYRGAGDKQLQVAMRPADFEKIETTGAVTAFLEFEDENGRTVHTDSLETQVTTVVNELSFNLILEGTQFSSGSAELRPSALPALRKLGDYLQWAPEVTIVIEGFTDDMGAVEYNMMLAGWRANSVKQFLLDNFDVREENIFTVGHGPRFPVGDNGTRMGRQQNRRVEVLVNAKVGSEAILEAKALKESLVEVVTRPPDPFDVPVDSALILPGDQASTMIVNLHFPAFATADSITIGLTLLEDLYFAEGQASSQRWQNSLPAGADHFEQAALIVAPSGVHGDQEMLLKVQLFRDGEAISDIIQKPTKVYIE